MTRILFIVGEALSALTVVLMAMMARRMQQLVRAASSWFLNDVRCRVLKGRDFDFKGEIKIGNYRFRGPLFDFNFSNFSVNVIS